MAIDHEKLLAAIDLAREDAYGTDTMSSLGQARTKALEYYFGLNTNPAPEGRSQVVDRSVYETISVMLPSLVRIFASSSEVICKAVPVGPGDEQAAEQVTAVLNHYITAQNNWEQIAADWILDAMLLGNSYAMAYWDESETLIREKYEGQSDDQLAQLLSDKEVTVIEHTAEVDEQATADAQAQYQQAMQQYQQMMAHQPPPQPGMPPPPPPQQPDQVMKHALVLEREDNDDTLCIKVLPPEHCHVAASTPDWTLQACPYFEYRKHMTIADLQAMDLDIDEDASDDESNTALEDQARNRYAEDQQRGDASLGVMRMVWARMVWVRCDAEGDKKSRLYYCILVGRKVYYAEPCARISVASMTCQALPHRHPGMSIAETVFDLQDVGTAITRGGLDNLYLANNGRNVVSRMVNMEDLLDSRPGGQVRMLDDSLPAGHVVPLVHPFAFEQIIQSLEFFDQKRQNRTGASRTFSGNDPTAANDGWKKTVAVQTQAAMRVEHIARMMAPAVEALFSCVQEIISKHENKALTIKLKGQWVTVDPQEWRKKRDIKINVGVGAGNKDSMQAQLQNIFAAQLQMLPMGLAGPQELHATVTEMAKAAGFATPDKFWIDPTGKPPHPQQPSPEQQKGQTAIQIKQMELQADAQKFQATMQAEMQKIAAQSQAKLQELQASLQLQATNDQRDAMREEQRALLDAQLEQAKLEGEQRLAVLQADMDKYKADLDAQVKLIIADKQAAPPFDIAPVQQALQQIMDYAQAPSKIVRGPDGKATHVEKGGVARPIQRGPDGRAIGLQ